MLAMTKEASRRRLGSLVIVLRPCHGLVDNLQDIFPYHLSLAEDADARAVAVEDVSVGGQLLQLDLGQLHKPLDFVLGPVVVLDAEGVDGDDLDAAPIADFHDLGSGLGL